MTEPMFDQVTPPSRPVWVSKSELVYRLAQTRATSDRYGLVNPAAISAVLAGLAELGVNPDELVRE